MYLPYLCTKPTYKGVTVAISLTDNAQNELDGCTGDFNFIIEYYSILIFGLYAIKHYAGHEQ